MHRRGADAGADAGFGRSSWRIVLWHGAPVGSKFTCFLMKLIYIGSRLLIFWIYEVKVRMLLMGRYERGARG